MQDDGHINGHRPERLMRLFEPTAQWSQPVQPEDLPVGAARALSSVTGLRAEIPPDAHTAPYLGSDREGNAVVIDDRGLVLTIGYLILESRAVSVATAAGAWVPATFVGYDFETGFGLVRAEKPLGIEPARVGSSADLKVGDTVVLGARGGPGEALVGSVVSRRPFAGYWEYFLDDAIFTAPPHLNWSGAAVLGVDGRLRALASLLVEDAGPDEEPMRGNLSVPIDLLTPILDELVANGRANRKPRPWLGMFTTEADGVLVVAHVSAGGPAERAGLEAGDIVVRVNREPVDDLADMYQRVWAMGSAGVEVPLTVVRDTSGIDLVVRSTDRSRFFRTPRN